MVDRIGGGSSAAGAGRRHDRAHPTRGAAGALGLASCTGCLVGPVRIIDHSYATSANRQTSSVEVALETTSKGRRVDLMAGDDIASFTFRVRPGKILATIRNEGTEPLWLVLEEARHVDPEGERHELYVAAPDLRGADRRDLPGSTPLRRVVACFVEHRRECLPRAHVRGNAQ